MIRPDYNLAPIGRSSDAELAAACLTGDRESFGRIAERYQRLLCSLAYSATGNLSESEDLAQEAFVDAWRQLPTLREPEKLRPWLCGILRYKVSRLRRSDRREPVRQAEVLEQADEVASGDEPAATVATDLGGLRRDIPIDLRQSLPSAVGENASEPCSPTSARR